MISKDAASHKIIADIAGGLTYFACGVAVSAAAMGLMYVVHFLTGLHTNSQKKVWEHPYVVSGRYTDLWKWLKIALHVLAVVLAIISVILFVVGLLAVKHAVTSLP